MVDCETREEYTKKHKQITRNPENRLRKKRPKPARVKHVPSPGAPTMTIDLPDPKSTPSEVGKASCDSHAQEKKEKPSARASHVPNRNAPHELIRALVAVTLYWFPSLYLGKIS
jgi:hypothetical protein